MQTVIIAGNVGNVKDLKTVGSDEVLNFSVAVDNGKDKNGEKRETTWWYCALWGKRAAALAPYITKGSKLTVSGRPGARAHDGKAYLTLSVNELTLMGGGSDTARSSGDSSAQHRQKGPEDTYDLSDDIPF